MPIFRLEEDKLIIAQETNVELEKHLENWLENSPRQTLAREDFLWIDRQPSAQDEEGTIFPDLLGVDSEGNLVIIEFKRGKTPRSVVAQLLEYAAWANELSSEQIHETAEAYFETRDEFRGRTFPDVFREVFEIPETDELPPFNQQLRMFVVAEEIAPRIASVCRFLRASYGMDISCIDVSAFQTETGEVLVSTETKVGDEDVAAPKAQKQKYVSPSFRGSADRPLDEVVWESVQEFTNGKIDREFTLKDIELVVSKNHPHVKKQRVRERIRGGCVKFPTREQYRRGEDRYWYVSKNRYRLYDPEKDKM